MKIKAALAVATLGLFTVAGNASATTMLSGEMTADNAFFLYLSNSPSTLGTLLTSANNWPDPTYLAPTALAPGANYLNIEVVNEGGPGGFEGTFHIGSETLETNLTQWTGSYNDSNPNYTAQPWVTPTGGVQSYGANGVGPWNFIGGGIDSNAQWIWASDTSSNQACASSSGFCTIDLSVQLTTGGVPETSTWAMLLIGFAGLGFAGYRRTRAGLTL